MEKLLLDLEMEITNGQEHAKKARELYELLSSYNAYSILLLKAKQEYEGKKLNIKQYYSDSDCYTEQIDDLFSLFKSDEYIRGKLISGRSHEDMMFLIDQDTLLRIHSFDIMNSPIGGLSSIDYNLIKIDDCKAKVFIKNVYSRDPYYYAYSSEYKDAFGFFQNKSLVTPVYTLDSQFRTYDNMDIREILKVQTLDEIYEKMTEAKNEKEKKLVLTK